MPPRKEVFRYLIIALTLVFFISQFTISEKWSLLKLGGYLSLVIAVALVIWGERKGMVPEDVRKRMNMLSRSAPALIPAGYGMCIILIALGIFAAIQKSRIDIGIAITAFSVALMLFFRHLKSLNEKHAYK